MSTIVEATISVSELNESEMMAMLLNVKPDEDLAREEDRVAHDPHPHGELFRPADRARVHGSTH